MIELIIVFTCVMIIANAPLYSVLIFFILLIYSFKKHSTKAIQFVVIILLFKIAINHEHLKGLLVELHKVFYAHFVEFISNTFTGNYVNFLVSITVGTSDLKLTKSTYDLFKQFNLLHVVSISGANFALIKDVLIRLSYYFNKKLVCIFILIIQSYYIFLIGFSNLPALRAYIFSFITLYSTIYGRPIAFTNKLVLTILIILSVNPSSIGNSGFLLSIGFSLLYKALELRPFNLIFNTELKKLSLVFIISVFIFNSSNPDFIANILFGITYPIIFIGTFVSYIFVTLGIYLPVINQLINILIKNIFSSLGELSSSTNKLIQIAIFIAILITTLKSTFKNRINEYYKFSQ